MNHSGARAVLFFVGAVLGVLIVRALFLEPIEEAGWRMFWEGASQGNSMPASTVLHSTTFAKCTGGFVVGGVIGLGLSLLLRKKPDQPK